MVHQDKLFKLNGKRTHKLMLIVLNPPKPANQPEKIRVCRDVLVAGIYFTYIYLLNNAGLGLVKVLRTIGLLALMLLCAACTGYQQPLNLGDSNTAEERRLLVTFVDKSINRSVSGNPLDNYNIHIGYGNSGMSRDIAQDLAEQYHLQFIAQWPVTELGVSCVVYEAPEHAPLQQVIDAIQKNAAVASVQHMNSFNVLGGKPAATQPYSDPYFSLQSSFKSLGIGDVHSLSTGRGVRIAVIDTGVDTEHPDLVGQIKYSENLAPEPADNNLADVHGTAVTGILSARPDNGIGIAGIAPDAEIYALRACWPDKPGALAARCNSFTLALAVNQAIRLGSRIINLSLSGPDDSLLRQLLEKALAKGIIVIAALPGKDQAGGFPANIPGVFAVGLGGEDKAGEIAAPGLDILTTVPHQAYDYMTGSSFATPHVAGVIALILQLHPDWQTSDMKRLIGERLSHLSVNNLEDFSVSQH